MDTLGPKLKELREQRRLSQQALADESGLTPSYISKIENGALSGQPSSGAVVSLANALKVDEVELLAAADRVPSPFEIVGRQPEAARFFRRAAGQIRDPQDWNRLSDHLDSSEFRSRSRGGGQDG